MLLIARGRRWFAYMLCPLLVACGVAGAVPAGSSAEQASQPTSPAAARLDAGTSFTCAIVSGGQVRCWGYGLEGELGYPGVTTVGASNTPTAVGPVNIGAGSTATAISSGDFHTCVIRNDGSVLCWGYGGDGRLGYGSTSNVGDTQTPGSAGPVNLGGHTAKAISAGGANTCAILDDNSVRCWGFGGDGQLGYSNMNSVGDTPSDTPNTVGPVNLGPGRTAVAISAGGRHTCAILDNGQVLCWGDDGNGQLGYGNTNTVSDPGAGHQVNAIACFSATQCTAVDNTGRQVTFDPSNPGNPTPVAIDGVNYIEGVACPLATQCTGVDDAGSVVTFDPTTPGTSPPLPTVVDNGNSLIAVACPSAILCTAVDNVGQEVTFNPTSPGSPTPVAIDGTNFLASVACPSTTLCTAVDNTGQVVTFDPTNPVSPTATNIDSHSLNRVACPSMSRCIAVDSNGVELTFNPASPGTPTPVTIDGTNYLSAVACPSTTECTATDDAGQQVEFNPAAPGTPTPTPIDGTSFLAGVACPSITQCTAVDSNGRQVTFNPTSPGTPTPATIDTIGPVDIGPGHTATAISAGANHTCAILDDRTVRCWGYGSDGELGYGNRSKVGDDETPDSAGPVDLGAGRKAQAISAGANHTCAILDDGTVRCWGLGASGRLGYGNTNNVGDYQTPGSVGPVDLGVGRTAAAISAGGRHTCALLDNASVRCWGYGANGQLGYCNESDIGATQTPGSAGPVNLQPGDGGELCPSPPAGGPPPSGPPGNANGPPAVNADAARAKAFTACLRAVAARAKHARALTHRGSARQRVRAKRNLARQLARGRKHCVQLWGRTPGQVTGLQAIARGKTSIELDFAAPGTNGKNAPVATTYLIKQSLHPIRSQHDFARDGALCHGACRFTVTKVGAKITLSVTDLRPSTTYYYAIVALDNVTARPGPRSVTVKVKTG